MKALDRVFELLAAERRRYVLYYLEEQDGPVPISEVSETVQKWERSPPSESEPEHHAEDIAITLAHRDVPKLREVEYIDYDPENEEIQISGEPAEIDVILSVCKAIEQPREDDIIHLG